MQQILQSDLNLNFQKMNIHPDMNTTECAISTPTILLTPKLTAKLWLLLLAAIIASFLPLTSHAQLPNLGTAENFVLFTSAGALGNTGVSTLNGDIGTN